MHDLTPIYGLVRSGSVEDLKRILRVNDTEVVAQPDPNRKVDFRVEVGKSYGYNSCVPGNAEDEIQAGPPVVEGQ
jgi:hypothetical protein